jgi:aryl-alcohol dehydrogenase-like predicted oxidoreductase
VEKRRVGSLEVSLVGIGCNNFGWRIDADATAAVVDAALDCGINFFDTADMYSLGVSEEVTGRALRAMANRDEIVIATKVFYKMTDKPNMGGLSRKHIMQACEASLRRLGIDTIDLYQIHRFDANTPIEETLAALDYLVHQGKVRYIGASSGYAWQLMRALSISEHRGWARFISMQNHYNLVYREEEREMIPLCRSEGLGMIPWSPLARGRLARPHAASEARETGRGQSDVIGQRLYDDKIDWSVVDAIERVAAERSVPMAEVALAWLLAKPGVVAPIVGATKLDQLETAIRALDLELTQEEMATLEKPYTPKPVVF